jgi:copper chaperone
MTGPSTPETAGADCAAMSPPPSSAAADAAESRASQRLDLAVAGMTCGHCVRAVSNALNGLPGVEVDDVRIGRASVRLEPKTVLPAALIEVLREAGYAASFASGSGLGNGAGTAVSAEAKTGLPQAPTSGGCCSSR